MVDPHSYGVQKYSNRAVWNVPGGGAPNGVSATRYLRRTAPDVAQLSPLAVFLVEHCPKCVAGNYPALRREDRVRCYNGLTEAETIRAAARVPDSMGCYRVNGMAYCDHEEAVHVAEAMIKCYGLEGRPTHIEDWHFDIIAPTQTDEDYWNRQAARMVAAGVIRVEIGENVFRVGD